MEDITLPIYQNITSSDLYLSGENGLAPDFRVPPNETFHGSENFYRRYSGNPEYLIERTTDGFIGDSSVLTGPDQIFVELEGYIKPDLMTASDDDAANNTEITSGSDYTAFGKIRWTDFTGTGLEHEVDFSITGLGDHGAANEAVFSIGSVSPGGATQLPTEVGSRLDISGSITFAMTGSGAVYPEVEVVYEMSRQGFRFGDTNELLNQPNFVRRFEYVTASDINDETYVTGSENEIKSEIVFHTGAKVGDPAKRVVHLYKDLANPTSVTHKIEEKRFVTAADLP
jgi:hypothetical protein